VGLAVSSLLSFAASGWIGGVGAPGALGLTKGTLRKGTQVESPLDFACAGMAFDGRVMSHATAAAGFLEMGSMVFAGTAGRAVAAILLAMGTMFSTAGAAVAVAAVAVMFMVCMMTLSCA
jgi:hypothetical protein